MPKKDWYVNVGICYDSWTCLHLTSDSHMNLACRRWQGRKREEKGPAKLAEEKNVSLQRVMHPVGRSSWSSVEFTLSLTQCVDVSCKSNPFRRKRRVVMVNVHGKVTTCTITILSLTIAREFGWAKCERSAVNGPMNIG